MNRVLDPRAARGGGRAPDSDAAAVSVLRWPAGGSASEAFEMFSARQAGACAFRDGQSPEGRENVLLVSASRSAAPDTPAVHLSFVNTSPSQAVKLSLKLAGPPPTSLAGTVLTVPATDAGEGFEAFRGPRPTVFRGAVLTGKAVAITVPARSVVVLTLR